MKCCTWIENVVCFMEVKLVILVIHIHDFNLILSLFFILSDDLRLFLDSL